MSIVHADYLDGHSTRVRLVTLASDGSDLTIVGDGIDQRIPFAQIRVDEQLGRVSRRLRLPDGAICEVRDLGALDLILAGTPHRDGWVDRLQRRWRFIAAACVACVGLALIAYTWGLPWAAAVAARNLPAAVSEALSVQTLKILDQGILLPSKLPAERQRSLLAAFHRLHLPAGGSPDSELLFR